MYSATRLARHDVVRDHDVGPAVLGVDLLDQLAEQRRAHRVQAGVGLVEEHDVGVEHERAREAGALAHAARELVRRLVARALEAHLAQAPHDDVLDLVLALVGVLAERERDVVVEVHRAEERAVLEQDAELLAHLEELVVGHGRHGLAVHEHVALVGIEQADHVLDADRLPVPDGPRIIEILSSGMPRLRPRRILLRPNALCTSMNSTAEWPSASRCAPVCQRYSSSSRPAGSRRGSVGARSGSVSCSRCRSRSGCGFGPPSRRISGGLRSSATVSLRWGLAGSRPRRSGCRACR